MSISREEKVAALAELSEKLGINPGQLAVDFLKKGIITAEQSLHTASIEDDVDKMDYLENILQKRKEAKNV